MTSPSVTLRQLAEAATPGPWFIVGPPWNEGAPFINSATPDPHGGEVVCDFTYTGHDADWRETNNSEANAALIALAPALAVGLADAIDALEAAEKEASIAHDAIWSEDVASASILHENEREDSAQAAIWRLHEAIRPVLARLGDLVGQP